MYINNNWIFLGFKLLCLIVSGWGLSYYVLQGNWASFNYYTVLSNLVCFLYFLGASIHSIRLLAAGMDVSPWHLRLEGAVVFCITVTFLIYHFMLRPESFTMGGDNSGFWNTRNMIVHYAVPLLTLLDWLLFCPKGVWRKWDPLKWLIIPLAYFAYILARAPLAGNIGGTSSPYPYFFINVDKLGWGGVFANAAWIALAMAVLAYAIYFIDRGIARLGRAG